MKILAVDDDPAFLDLLVDALRAIGMTDVVTVPSAREARRLLQKTVSAFDCFLLDVSMPEESGISLCRSLRQIAAYLRTPIIMLTTVTRRDSIDEAFAVGATDYVNKPLDIFELSARLRVARLLLAGSAQEVARLDPVDVGNVDPLISCLTDDPTLGLQSYVERPALINYLAKLSQFDLYRSSVTAFVVGQFDKLVAEHGAAAGQTTVVRVAGALAGHLSKTRVVLSYWGAGTFVCVTRRADPHLSPSLLRNINGTLAVNCDDYSLATNFSVELRMGVQQTSQHSSLTSPTELVNRAVTSARSADVAAEALLRLAVSR